MKRPRIARYWPVAAVPMCLSLVLSTVGASAVPADQADQTIQSAPACAAPTAPPAPPTPTTVSTIEQVYRCLFDHAYGGAALDDRTLLTAAFAGLTQELNRHGLDLADATMPALSGDRTSDWAAFSAAYQQIDSHLPDDPDLRQAVAAATINGMLGSLNDNHVRWQHPQLPPADQAGRLYGLGIVTSPAAGLANSAPQEALPPLFVRAVQGGPAADNGVRPGDVIESVNGSPPFVDGVLSRGVINLLDQKYPRSDRIELRLHRPANGRTRTVTMTPRWFTPTAAATQMVTSKLLGDTVAYVQLAQFGPNAADMVRQAIVQLGDGRALNGVVLDLRGNGGGAPPEVGRLLGAFAHGKVTAYQCDADDNCRADHTDDTVPLLNLPLVVLTDRSCASACEHFSNAVKDLRLGTLVGTRTAGVISGAAAQYLLDDNSLLSMPSLHHLGADREPVNGIGVAPDHHIPLTAKDVSTGHDPDIEKALSLLAH